MNTKLGVIAAVILAILLILAALFCFPRKITYTPETQATQTPQELPKLNSEIKQFLESKESPLSAHTDFLLEQEHWKLLIAISAIESRYCKSQLGFNCWGIGGDSNYRKYSSIRAAIVDANDLITAWQSKGRWLTVEDMNCSYVQPCNPNWVNVVNKNLKELDAIILRTTSATSSAN